MTVLGGLELGRTGAGLEVGAFVLGAQSYLSLECSVPCAKIISIL